jgi:pimeloyl-ACP methyl ester carboxylesterase
MPTLQVAGTAVHYSEQGIGEPVVLLHSSGGSSAQWRALAERLSSSFRVIAPDLYGYGATPGWPGQRPFSLAQEAEIVFSLIGRLGEPAHLIGHSFGGAVALHVARERSDLLRSLAVIEPVAFHLLRDGGELDAQALNEISAVAAGVCASLGCGDYAGGFGRFVDYWSGPGAWQSMPEARRAAFAPSLAKVALDFHATINEPASLADFACLALPALVVQGGKTALPTERICRLLAATLPEVGTATVPGAGHMLPITHRDAVNDLLAAHLEANAVQPRNQSWKPRNTPKAAAAPNA